MNVDLEHPGKPVKVIYRYSLPAGLYVSNGPPRKPYGSAYLSLVEAEPSPMQANELTEPRIECQFVHVLFMNSTYNCVSMA